MPNVESTPEMAAHVYDTMAKNLKVVRRRVGKPLTLADKVLLGHLDDPEHQEMQPGKSYLFLRPDRVVFQDVLGQTGLLQFMQTLRERVTSKGGTTYAAITSMEASGIKQRFIAAMQAAEQRAAELGREFGG